MTVRITLDVGIQTVELDAPTFHMVGESQNERLRDALAILDGLRNDVARMIGAPEIKPRCACGTVPLDGQPGSYTTEVYGRSHSRDECFECNSRGERISPDVKETGQ